MIVNPISLEPSRAASMRLSAGLHVPDDVLEHDDGIVHDEPDGQREGHEREVVNRVAQQVHGGERAHDRHRQGQAGNDRRREIPQEEEDDEDDQEDGEEQGEFDVTHGLADGNRAVVQDVHVHRRRNLRPKRGQQLSDPVHDLDGVRARLPLDGQDDGPHAVVPTCHLVGLDAVNHLAEIPQSDGRAVPVRHDEGAIGGGVGELPRGLHVEGLIGAVEGSRREVHVALGDGLLDLVDADAPRGQRVGVELNAHGVLLRAEHLHLGHAVDRGDALRQQRLRVLVHDVQRQGRRAEGEVEDRLVGRVHLLIGGRRGHARRQLRGGLADGRLDVLGGGIDVPVEAELDRDVAEAEGARGRHGIDAGDGAELLLQGRRHRRGHRIGTGAREARRRPGSWESPRWAGRSRARSGRP